MNFWKQLIKAIVLIRTLSVYAFQSVTPHLLFSNTFPGWTGVRSLARRLAPSEEPSTRTQLISFVRRKTPDWSSVAHLLDDVEVKSWSKAICRLDCYRSFLERVFFKKTSCDLEDYIMKTCANILETCAVYLDYMTFLESAPSDAAHVAICRSIYTKFSQNLEIVMPVSYLKYEQETVVKQIWSTLLSTVQLERSEKLLLLDIWSFADTKQEQCQAAAAAVYSMLLLDFLKDHGDAWHFEQFKEVYRMVVEGSSAIQSQDPPMWFSQMAALALGISSKPKPRC